MSTHLPSGLLGHSYLLYQVIANKPLALVWIDPLVIYALFHLVEAFLFLRYYFLLPLYLVFSSNRPKVIPLWIGKLVYLQPTTLETTIVDVFINDSRARKMLGLVIIFLISLF